MNQKNLRQLLDSSLGKHEANTGVDSGELQKELLLVAAVSDLPNTTSHRVRRMAGPLASTCDEANGCRPS
ncbi:MAG TPA: hypothetical protein VMR88_02045, partial [Candidatus Polarisedimenticolaceae bacterium]|nr:hypothetical protein [Candidatus Polarisedimenticolaceae bacterium]